MKSGEDIQTKAKQFLSVLATQAEDYLKFKGYSSEKLSQTLTFYLAAKLIDWKQMRFTWYGVFTNKQDESGFMMYGRNSFETFSNYTEAKVQESAFLDGKSSLVEQIYCRPFSKLDPAEKRMVLFHFVKRSTLEYFEGTPMTGLSELLGEPEGAITPTEESKTLVVSNLDVLAFRRVFFSHEKGYRYPVTIQIFGCSSEIYGMSVKVYDPESPQEDSNSQFLVVFNSLETGNKAKNPGKKKTQLFNLEDYRNKFSLIEVMENGGFDVVLNRLIEKPKATISPKLIFLQVPKGLVGQVLPLEQVFSFTQ